jgi:hypothetical protein
MKPATQVLYQVQAPGTVVFIPTIKVRLCRFTMIVVNVHERCILVGVVLHGTSSSS